MGRAFTPPLSNVDFHGPLGVDWEPLVRVDGNTEQARVGVDELILVPHNRVPQDAGIIEVGQARHVIRAVKLGRIHLPHLVLLENLGLQEVKEKALKN
jgi:hypothetical protein